MINNTAKNTVIKAESTAHMIYEPKGEWTYSHHASITFFKGRFYAVWSNGEINEDDCKQRVLMAESVDGEQWVNIRPIVTSEMVGDPDGILLAAGFHVTDDTMNIYFGYYTFAEWFLNNGKVREPGHDYHENTDLGVISTNDGITFGKPRLLGIPLVPNHGPQKTASGRLIIAGNIMFPYTDHPDGVSDYQISGIYGDVFENRKLYDDSESIGYVTKAKGWDTNLICEGAFFQTDDKILHMMLRSNTEYLWCSESRDDGMSWSEPYKTGYTDCGSKMHFGRLPDGRFYGVSNPVWGSGRNPLTLCISKDGENFDRHYVLRDEPYQMKYPGMHKGGDYGYPHSLIHDGYLYVIYSKQKEAVEVTKISLEQIGGVGL